MTVLILALWLVWILSGTPALTYAMLLRETAREDLVEDMTVLYDEPWFRGGEEERRVSYLQNGDRFWTLRYTVWPYEDYTDLVWALTAAPWCYPVGKGPGCWLLESWKRWHQ